MKGEKKEMALLRFFRRERKLIGSQIVTFESTTLSLC